MKRLLLLLALTGCVAAAPPAPEARRAARAPDARCSACTSPLAGDAWAWPDGRVVCGACRAEAVVDLDAALALLAAAREELALRFGVAPPAAPVTLDLVDLPTLTADAAELAHPTLQAFSEVATRERRVEAVRIEALYGLPRAALRGILVHELFHACQSAGRADAGPVDLELVEGAAEYVQLRALEAQGEAAWAARLLANEDPTYGRGLRRFRALVAAVGEARALATGVSAARFPAGY